MNPETYCCTFAFVNAKFGILTVSLFCLIMDFLLIAEREKGRLEVEIQRINNEINVLTERRNVYEVKCFQLFSLYF